MAAQEEATAAATRRRKRGHPLLRRCKRERYTHGLHPAQMEALRAMCGALIPSLPVAEAGLRGDGGRKDLERFYHASAADGAIPEEVAELVTRCVWEAVVLVNVVLWILSTMVGTLALCGRLSCISGEFPYVRKFADMPPERREQALARWNKARWLFPLKITFVVIKILSHYAFYTTVAVATDGNKGQRQPCHHIVAAAITFLREEGDDRRGIDRQLRSSGETIEYRAVCFF